MGASPPPPLAPPATPATPVPPPPPPGPSQQEQLAAAGAKLGEEMSGRTKGDGGEPELEAAATGEEGDPLWEQALELLLGARSPGTPNQHASLCVFCELV